MGASAAGAPNANRITRSVGTEENGVHNGRNDLAANFAAGMEGRRRVDVYISAALENCGALGVREFDTASDRTIGAEGTDVQRNEIDHDAGGS